MRAGRLLHVEQLGIGIAQSAAPSDALRRWFHASSEPWEAFRDRYFAELDRRPEAWEPILKAARNGTATLLYAARDQQQNVVALREYLMRQLQLRK
ncbi:MAG: DUF488 family protein [Acidobacteria bacterium]|nr:DUF488 family protein [Acidobacteriota bacterium]